MLVTYHQGRNVRKVVNANPGLHVKVDCGLNLICSWVMFSMVF